MQWVPSLGLHLHFYYINVEYIIGNLNSSLIQLTFLNYMLCYQLHFANLAIGSSLFKSWMFGMRKFFVQWWLCCFTKKLFHVPYSMYFFCYATLNFWNASKFWLSRLPWYRTFISRHFLEVAWTISFGRCGTLVHVPAAIPLMHTKITSQTWHLSPLLCTF